MIWDQESYCCADGCHQPAAHSVLVTVVDDAVGRDDLDYTGIYEMRCCAHAA